MPTKTAPQRWRGVDLTKAQEIDSEAAAYLDLIEWINSGKRIIRIACPHCGDLAAIRNSRRLSPLSSEYYCNCQNPACGHTFKGISEIVATISPSAIPDPAIEKLIGPSLPGRQADRTGRTAVPNRMGEQ